MADVPRLQKALLNTAQSNSNLFALRQSTFEQQLAMSLLLEPDGISIFDNSFWSPHLARYLSRFVHEEEGSWISAGLEFPADTDDTSPLTILRKNTSARTLADILSFYQKSAIGHYQDYPVDYARLSKIDLTGRFVDPQNVSEKIVDALADIFATPSMEYFLFLQENRERFHDADSIGQWLLNGFEIARRAFEECREAYVKNHDGRPGTDIRVSDMLKTVYRLRFREDLRPKADVGMKKIITEAWTSGPERECTLSLFRFLSALYGRRDAAQNDIAINDRINNSGLYEFFLAAHMCENSSLVSPIEDFEFQMPSPSILVNTKGSYLKAVRGSQEFTEYRQAWQNWRKNQSGSPDAGKEKLKEKLRAYAKKMVAEIKPEHMRHAYALDPTKIRSQTLVRLAMTENAHFAKYISGVLGGGLAYVISKNPLLSGAAGTVIGTTVSDILSDPRVKRLISLGREKLLSQTAFITSDAAGTFVKAGYKSPQVNTHGREQ